MVIELVVFGYNFIIVEVRWLCDLKISLDYIKRIYFKKCLGLIVIIKISNKCINV